jgi:molybdenum cofactor biosynthesis enzyme MoaA
MTEYPRLVAIETTNACNARCSFCPNNRLSRKRRAMSDLLFEKLLDDCRAFEPEAIEPFLNGEPFADPKIIPRLELIRRRLPRSRLRLYTNGAALGKDQVDALCRLGVDHLYVSLNTLDPRHYRELMGLELDGTLANLAYLVDRRERAARSITFRMTRTDATTLEEQRAFKAFCRRLGVRAMIVGAFNYLGCVAASLPVPSYPCEHIDRIDVLADGRVALCCMDTEGAFALGDASSDHLLEVFNGERARAVREALRAGRRHELEPCNACNLFWPGLSHLGPWDRLRFAAESGRYFLRHRPVGVRAPRQAEGA